MLDSSIVSLFHKMAVITQSTAGTHRFLKSVMMILYIQYLTAYPGMKEDPGIYLLLHKDLIGADRGMDPIMASLKRSIT